MVEIDSRLKEAEGEPNITENFNRVLGIVDSAVELPEVTVEDEGKVLTVDDEGSWDVADVPSELPAVTSDDNGKVLTVVDGVWTAVLPIVGEGEE